VAAGRWRRRALLQGAAALAGAAALPRAHAWAKPALRTPTSPLGHVLIAGDSMIAGGVGLFLERRLEADAGLVVRRRGVVSSGLARPDFFDWQAEAARLTDVQPPDVTVVMFGGNDVQGLWMGRDHRIDGRPAPWIRFDEPGWDAEYARRVVALAEQLAPAADPDRWLFWIGMPAMRPPGFHAKVQHLNKVVRGTLIQRERWRFLTSADVLTAADGAYVEHMRVPGREAEGKRRVRASDGIHLAPLGAELVCAEVERELRAALSPHGWAAPSAVPELPPS
jgi:hypothetical protein